MAKLFNSIAEVDAACGYTMWQLGHNFTDYDTGTSPPEANAVSDGIAFKLQKLGTNTPTKLTAPRANYLDQGAMRIDVADGLMYKGADANFSVNPSVPTAYFLHFRAASSDTTEQNFFAGLTGTGSEGWRLTIKGSGANAGLRLAVMGTQSAARLTTACDGSWQSVLVVVDAANGRARMFTTDSVAQVTGITYSQTGHLICTIGGISTGDTFTKAIENAIMFKGEHANAYNDGQIIFDRLRQDIIARSMGVGGLDYEGSAGAGTTEDIGSLGAGAVLGAMNAFDSEWDEALLFSGADTINAPAAAGSFEVASSPTEFAGGVVLDAPTVFSVFVRSRFLRQDHVALAVGRIVDQLLGNYNPNTFESIGQVIELGAPTASGTFEWEDPDV